MSTIISKCNTPRRTPWTANQHQYPISCFNKFSWGSWFLGPCRGWFGREMYLGVFWFSLLIFFESTFDVELTGKAHFKIYYQTAAR